MATSRTLLLAASVVLLLFVLAACGEEDESTLDRIPRVRAFEVGETATGQVRTFSGELAAAESSPLSFGVSGTIVRVMTEVGQAVEAETLLALLDAKPLQLQAEQARAELGSARAKAREAEQAYDRASRLLPQRAVSKADVEAATAALRSARATLQAAQSRVEQAERDLAHVELRAPFAGTISERSVEPFQEIGANEPAFVLQSDSALVVQALVPEALIRLVRYGQPVRVRFPTLGDAVEEVGLVSLISAQAAAGNAFPVEVQLPPGDLDLRPGMTASVTFNLDAHLADRTVYLIPISALALDAGIASPDSDETTAPVFVYDEETSRLELRKIRAGGLRGNRLEVFEGLEAGDKVITAGVAFLRDGMEVELWTAEQGLD